MEHLHSVLHGTGGFVVLGSLYISLLSWMILACSRQSYVLLVVCSPYILFIRELVLRTIVFETLLKLVYSCRAVFKRFKLINEVMYVTCKMWEIICLDTLVDASACNILGVRGQLN